MWWQILELLKNLSDETKDSAFVKIHYPSAVEPEEIIKFIWKKEIDAFKKFIVDKKLGESEKIIESVKKLNTIYRKRYPNWYLFLIDDMQDMSNAFSRIRKMQSFLKNTKEFNSTLGYIIDFKKLLDYDDFDFRGYI